MLVIRTASIAVFCTLAAGNAAPGLVVDGNLNNRGARVTGINTSTSAPLTGLILQGTPTENQCDVKCGVDWLGPDGGRQNRDAGIPAVVDNSTLYIVVISGRRNHSGLDRYSPGDLHVKTCAETIGLTIGGRDSSYIGAGAPGSTLTAGVSGFTTAHVVADAQQAAGSIWSEVTWPLDPIAPKAHGRLTMNGSSTKHGTAGFIVAKDVQAGQAAASEQDRDIEFVGGITASTIGRRSAGGNDEPDATVAEGAMPEPVTMLFLLGGGGAIAVVSRRRDSAELRGWLGTLRLPTRVAPGRWKLALARRRSW
jgi:hypothetical protein